LKDRVKRGKLKEVEYLQNFIQHSINCFPKCLNKEPL
jgi:hypothetical protein